MNGADRLTDCLLANGVNVCFANPGTSEMHFVAALDRKPQMRCILGLFEGVVTGAADGYARMTGRPAATLLHTGPGLANGLANLHNARRAQTPIINIVGDHAAYHLPFDAPLTSDIESLARPMSQWVARVTGPDQVVSVVEDAYRASLMLPGVSTVILPADSAWGEAKHAGIFPVTLPEKPVPSVERIRQAVEAIKAKRSRCGIILGGDGLFARSLEIAGQMSASYDVRLFSPVLLSRTPPLHCSATR